VEYLVTMTTHVPGGTSGETVDGVRAREAAHTRELAAQGHVLRLGARRWHRANGGPSACSPPPPPLASLSGSSPRCRCGSGAPMKSSPSPVIRTIPLLLSPRPPLPLNPYLTTRTTKLTPHPSDPAAPGSRSE
jgi:muconolactone delta-isomerase